MKIKLWKTRCWTFLDVSTLEKAKEDNFKDGSVSIPHSADEGSDRLPQAPQSTQRATASNLQQLLSNEEAHSPYAQTYRTMPGKLLYFAQKPERFPKSPDHVACAQLKRVGPTWEESLMPTFR
eukprot:4619998-Amphidinium_carterae.2